MFLSLFRDDNVAGVDASRTRSNKKKKKKSKTEENGSVTMRRLKMEDEV